MILNSLFFSSRCSNFSPKALWEKNGAVIMAVGQAASSIREVRGAFEDLFIGKDPTNEDWGISSQDQHWHSLLFIQVFLV